MGAFRDDDNGNASGSAYIFERKNNTWVEVAKLTASDGNPDDIFGGSVSISGDFAIVGATLDDENGTNSGSAYIYGPSIPRITSTAITSGSVGTEYSYQLTATSFPKANFSLSAKPSGMIVSETGLITWMPQSTGSFPVTAVATNAAGSEEQSFTITVTEAPQAPSITSAPIESATVGVVYAYNVEAEGTPPITFSFIEKPEGMVIDENSGLITWTPTTAGVFPVKLRAANPANPPAAEQSFTIEVASDVIAPVITPSLTDKSATVGEEFEYDVDASGTPAPTFSLANSHPPNMMIDAVSGLITWTPSSPGNFAVTVVAANGVDPADAQSFTIAVADASFVVTRNETFSDFTERSSYQLLSLPGSADIDIGATLSGSAGTDWNAFYDSGAESDYFVPYQSGSTAFRFRPGRGFWVLSKSRWVVEATTVAPVALDTNGNFTLSGLHPGWNLIASPFDEALSWEAVKTASGLDPTAIVLGYDGSGYAPATQLLPYKAYLFDSPDGSALLMPHPSFVVAGKSSLPQLSLRVSDEEGRRAWASVVLSAEANEGRDALDQRAPRSDFASLSMGFDAGDGELLAIEAYPQIGEGAAFELIVEGEPGEEVVLEAIEQLEGYAAALAYEGELVSMAAGAPARLRLREEVNRYQLLVGSETYLAGKEQTILPEELMLRGAYPNPFTSEATIGYALPEAANVEISIYDVLGREVAQLVSAHKEAGSHEIRWEGADQQGRVLPAGLYIAQLRTERGASKSITMMKVE